MRKIFLSGCLVAIALTIFGCQGNEKEINAVHNGTVVVNNINVDNYFVKGANKQTFDKVPERIIVVGENETETLLELGAAPNILMAVAQNKRRYAMRQENWKVFQTLKTCPSGFLNMEYVTSLHPDLIIAQQCVFIRNRLDNTDYWNQRGVKTLVPLNTNTPSKHIILETVDKEMQFIRDLGVALRVEPKAEEIIKSTYETIDNVNKNNISFPKPKVMIVEFISSMISYDRTKLVGDMVSRIGGKVTETPAVIGFENVVKENPDVLFVVCSHADYGECIKKITENPALKNLPCVKNKRVYSIPLRFTYGASCRTEDGLKFLAERMYPGINIEK